jgi:cytochrome c556
MRSAALLMTLALATASAAEAPTATDAIKARRTAMSNVRDAMKVLGGMAKGEIPFDAAAVQKNAGIVGTSFKAAQVQFVPGSAKGDVDTGARPEIWSDRAGFDAGMKSAIAAAAALEAVTTEAAYKPALGELGKNCKGCHDKYRKAE